jgi:hypothetical protein
VDMMSSVIQQSASGIAQIARTAEHLDGMTRQMQSLIQTFQVGKNQDLMMLSGRR